MIKNIYYNELFEYSTDIKITWQRKNSVLRPSWINPRLKLKLKYELLTDSTGKASTFINHFISVAQVLNANIYSLPDNPTGIVKRKRSFFVFLNSDAEEIGNIILPLKFKSAPMDEVQSPIYREIC